MHDTHTRGNQCVSSAMAATASYTLAGVPSGAGI